MNLPELLFTAATGVEKGSIIGTCILCGKETQEGLKPNRVVSGNFMGWNRFFAGDCFCPICAFLFSDQNFRKHSWCISPAGLEVFKNDEARHYLFAPPRPPFFIYIAKVGQRQSWLCGLHRVAMSRDRFFFCHENYDIPIFFERGLAETIVELIERALNSGVKKSELLTGQFRMKTWEKAIKEEWVELLNQAKDFVKNPLWEVIVDVTRINIGTREQADSDAGVDLQRRGLEEDALQLPL